MGNYAKGSRAFGFCDRCGFRYNLKELRTETVNLSSTNLRVCPVCWDPDQPQNMLGRIPIDDPQALRDPRPLGAISGRDLPAAYRWDFSTAGVTSHGRVGGWWPTHGVLTWNESSQSMNLVSTDPPPVAVGSGDPYIFQGVGESIGADPDYLSIDSSVYKYVVTQFTVNRFPDIEPEDMYDHDFQGELTWLDLSLVTAGQQRVNHQPYFPLSQASDGFEQEDRGMASTFKIVFDMTNNADWTGTIPILRLDFFDARNAVLPHVPDYDAGDIDIDYIEVVAFHNIDL